MVSTRPFIVAFALLCTVTATLFAEDFETALLKRQAPGTPAYECHDNCGTAIIISRSAADVCTNSTFLADYAACLACAGPDNEDIWKYYGTTLTTVATKCGLSTTLASNSTSASNATVSSTGVAITTTSSLASTSATLLATTTSSGAANGTASATAVVTGAASMLGMQGLGSLGGIALIVGCIMW